MDELVEQLKHQIVEWLNMEEVDPSEVDPDAPLFGDGLDLDSIDALELVAMLETHYGIQVENIEVGRQAMQSISAMAAFIRERQQAGTS